MNKTIRTILTYLLVISLVMAPGFSIAKAESEEDTQPQGDIASKTEVVYANLSAVGKVGAVYVVNQFEVSSAGTVLDYGNYSSVVNLKDTGALTQKADAISFHADAGTFYYQGNIATAELPWIVNASYELNGRTIVPADLAGQSGQLNIRISTRQNSKASTVFYDNYMLQISLALNNETCTDISAPGATIASAGEDTSITYTVFPGKDGDINISASVNNFEMDGIQIAGMPMSFQIELSDTDSMISDFDDLVEAIDRLNSGVGKLEDGANGLKSGVDQLETGSQEIQLGLKQLSDNSSQIISGSSQIKTALSQIDTSMSGSFGALDLSDMQQFPGTLSQLASELAGISSGLTTLKNNYASAYSALDSAIADIPGGSVSQDQINALYAGTEDSLHSSLDTLVAYYSAGRTVKSTYDNVKATFNAVAGDIDTLNAKIDSIALQLNQMSSQLDSALRTLDSLDESTVLAQVSQLTASLSTLSSRYASFHEGLVSYMGGVSQMSGGYSAFHNGLSAYANGMGDYADGMRKLHSGTTKLRNQTATLPDDVQTKIDDLASEYSGDDFTPVSFVSSKNTNVALVQFVLKCDGIESPESISTGDKSDTKQETFWDRFSLLFEGKN